MLPVLITVISFVGSLMSKRQALTRTKPLTASDGYKYWASSPQRAETLRVLTDFVGDVVDDLVRHYPRDVRVQRMRESVNTGDPLRLVELVDNSGAVAYTEGDHVSMCLQGGDMIAMKSVALHELAHVMQGPAPMGPNGHSVHDSEFKALEQMCLHSGYRLGQFPRDGAIGRPYCNIIIPDPTVAQ